MHGTCDSFCRYDWDLRMQVLTTKTPSYASWFEGQILSISGVKISVTHKTKKRPMSRGLVLKYLHRNGVNGIPLCDTNQIHMSPERVF